MMTKALVVFTVFRFFNNFVHMHTSKSGGLFVYMAELIACIVFQADTRALKMSAWKQLASEEGMDLVILNDISPRISTINIGYFLNKT